MPLQRYLIAPLQEGLVSNLKSWLIPENAFARLKNAYVWRGRLRKRFGSRLMENTNNPLQSRLRVLIGTTAGVTGNFGPFVVPGSVALAAELGMQFSIGTTIFTVYQNGAMLSTGAATGTYDTATGTVTIIGNNENPATSVYWYPSLPVMGIFQRNVAAVNNEPTVVFDRQFAYTYDSGTGGFLILGPNPPRATAAPVGGAGLWTSSDNQFFQAITWQNVDENAPANNIDLFYVVNNVRYNVSAGGTDQDGIKYYNPNTGQWVTPLFVLDGAGNQLYGARQVRAFKGRLLFFSTHESNKATPYINRVRYSWTRSVTNAEAGDAFFEASGKGGYIDAPTSEAIITTQFVKDRLIVYFERSTYQLVYTGSPDAPFVWQKIDTSVGAESMLSQVPFDNVVLGVGATGINACNGATVTRIDEKIPEVVWNIRNENSSFERVAGIRDYDQQMVYWTFPAEEQSQPSDTFPQQVLVFNYQTGTWSLNDDSFTVFGYHTLVTGLLWQNWFTPWQSSDKPWSYSEDVEKTTRVIAGNQRGYVVMIDNDEAINAPAVDITDINGPVLTVYDHNLKTGDFIRITRCQGSTNLNDQIVEVTNVSAANPENLTISEAGDAGYTGGGVIARVSRIDILTKNYNFYTNVGRNTFIPYVEFLVDKTSNGEITVDYFVGTNATEMITPSAATGALLGTNILETSPYALNATFESAQQQFWHRVYFQITAESAQMRLYFSDEQMIDNNISGSTFVLNAMLIYAQPNGNRLGY